MAPNPATISANNGMDSARNTRRDVTGPYPSGTLFEADVFYAIHSLVPRESTNRNTNAGRASTIANPVSASRVVNTSPPPRAGAKRFKPTLNCYQCVQRKTKCDRARPACLACVRRDKPCSYNALADILSSSNATERPKKRGRSTDHSDAVAGRPSTLPNATTPTIESPADTTHSGHRTDYGATPDSNRVVNGVVDDRVANPPASFSLADSAVPLSTSPSALMWDQPIPQQSQASAFSPPHGAGTSLAPNLTLRTILPPLAQCPARHPFGGEWTHSGGLDEVIQVMPRNEQANGLLAVYYDKVDPVNPILDANEFFKDHEAFWKTPTENQSRCDPTQVALFLGVYACAAQQSSQVGDRELVDVYISACHRALCLSLYLRLHSLRRCQAVFLICQCLSTDGRVSEAWTFAGLNQRQACSLGLNHAHLQALGLTSGEQWQRAQLWSALIHQDNMLSCVLKIPRSFTSAVSELPRSSIDPTSATDQSSGSYPESNRAVCDSRFYKALCKIAEFAQDHIFTPQMLSRSSGASTQDKSRMTAMLQATFDSFEPPFQDLDSFWIDKQSDNRLIRQGIELMCVFYYHMTLVLTTDEQTSMDVSSDNNKVIDSVHEGLAAFFALANLHPSVEDFGSIHHTLSYLQAVAVGTLLGGISHNVPSSASSRRRDPILMLAKSDFDRYLDGLVRATGHDLLGGIASERVRQLKELRKNIRVV